MSLLTPQTDALRADFATDLQESTQRLRGALTELFAALDADPEAPQEVSRRVGINRNVAWKLTRIIKSTDPKRTFQHMPGGSGMKIVLEAFRSAGAPAALVEAVHVAWARYEEMIERHAGDRPTFEMMLSGMNPELDGGQALRASRKAAFMGNSAVWGVQARVLFVTHVVAPNPDDPDFVDQAMVAGLLDMRRFRPNVRWVLGRKVLAPKTGEQALEEAIDFREESGSGLSLLRDFCTSPLPEIRTVPEPGAVRYELLEGPVGNSGALSCVFGWIQRRHDVLQREREDPYDEHFLRIGTPAEIAQIDLLVHEDLPFEAPRHCVFDLMQGEASSPVATQQAFHLPTAERIEDLGCGPPVVSTPHIHGYSRMMRLTTERLGHELEAFRGHRLTIAYPALSTMAVMWYTRERG